jgi:hypothetical protein
MSAKVSVGAGHAREHKGTGIGFFMVPEPERSPAWRLYALGCSYIKKSRGISPGSLVR